MGFIVEGNEQGRCVLNAVSPTITCVFPFADYVVDKIKTNLDWKYL